MDEVVRNPLRQVQCCLEKAVLENGGAVPAGDWGVHQFFAEAIAKAGLESVPYLSKTMLRNGKLAPNTLVRYRGMVQDMFDPEYFVGFFHQINSVTGARRLSTSKFMDNVQATAGTQIEMNDELSGGNNLFERSQFYCIPVPGESQWSSKRNMSGLRIADHALSTDSVTRQKRMREYDQELAETVTTNKRCMNQEKDSHMEDSPSVASESFKTSLGDEDELDCIVKVYDVGGEGPLKLTDVVEFVGVLAIEPLQTDMDHEHSDEPPSSLVPRLHCIVHRKLLTSWSEVTLGFAPPTNLVAEMSQVRSEMIHYLSAFVEGDVLAAEYLLLNMLSKVISRPDGTTPLGHLPVNLYHKVDSAKSSQVLGLGESLKGALSAVYPRVHLLKLTIPSLCKSPFYPVKNHATNRLSFAELQLAKHTILIIDEMQMDAGKIGDTGVKNLHALQRMVSSQQLNYDFQYHQMHLEVDSPILALSHGKSLLELGCKLLLQPNVVAVDSSPAPFPREEFFQRARMYLRTAGAVAAFTVSDDVAKQTQDEFIAIRKTDPKCSSEDFQRWVNIARLLTCSFGQTELTNEIWMHGRRMEKARVARAQNSQ